SPRFGGSLMVVLEPQDSIKTGCSQHRHPSYDRSHRTQHARSTPLELANLDGLSAYACSCRQLCFLFLTISHDPRCALGYLPAVRSGVNAVDHRSAQGFPPISGLQRENRRTRSRTPERDCNGPFFIWHALWIAAASFIRSSKSWQPGSGFFSA